MSRNIYVGNLPWSLKDEDLGQMFGEHGEVQSAKVIMDRMSGRSRGFGFVEMSTPEEASAAIEAINGSEHDGRTLKVDAAQERAPSRDNY
jgi:RNA recognition motif-containing protein|tara:strand:- start:672 stop:941 length:270 start_codon:yes stop_codon:yes gene_type:complete